MLLGLNSLGRFRFPFNLVKTGKPAFNQHYGIGYFDYIAQNQQLSQSFDLGMANLSEKEDGLIANSFDFSTYDSIVDLGGGIGGLLAEILKKNASLHGVVYELPHLEDRVEAFLQEQGLSSRVTVKRTHLFNFSSLKHSFDFNFKGVTYGKTIFTRATSGMG